MYLVPPSSSTSTPVPSASSTLPAWGYDPEGPTSAVTGSASVFDGAGGPALIIVFVALGLLVGAFVALLLIRRVPNRDMFATSNLGIGAWYVPPEPIIVGEEPKLFEARLAVDENASWKEHVWGEVSVSRLYVRAVDMMN